MVGLDDLDGALLRLFEEVVEVIGEGEALNYRHVCGVAVVHPTLIY